MKKMFYLFLTTLFLTTNLFSKQTNEILVDELESYMQNNIVIIDIREKEKWQKTGIIPGSYRLTYNNTKKDNNTKKWQYILVRLIKQKDRKFVLVSKDGKKAKDLSFKLSQKSKFRNALYLKGGIDSWLDADRRVINY